MIQNSIYPPRKTVFIFGVIVVLGSLIRIAIAASERLWIDELHTSWTVNSTLGDVATRAHAGNQPPVFFWLTWFSVNTFGHSELSLRLVSLLASIGLIAVAAWIIWNWTRSTIAASIAAWLIAVDFTPATTSAPVFLWNATEARPYALIQFFSLLQVASFWQWVREWFDFDARMINDAKPNDWRAYQPRFFLATISIAMIYTSFTCVWIFAIELLFILVYSLTAIARRRVGHWHRRVWWQALTSSLLIGLACIPAAIKMSTVFSRRSNWDSISSLTTLWLDQAIPKLIWLSIPIALAALIRLSHLIVARRTSREKQDKPDSLAGMSDCHSNPKSNDLVFLQWSGLAFSSSSSKIARLTLILFWMLGPLLIVTVLAYFEIAPVAHQRYTLVGSVTAPVLLGLVIGGVTSFAGRIALALVVVTMGLIRHPVLESAIWNRSLVTFRSEDWETAIGELNVNDDKRAHPVFLFSNLVEDVFAHENTSADFQDYLRFPVRGLYPIEESFRDVSPGPTLTTTHFTPAQINLAAEQGGGWVFVRDDPTNPTLAIEIADELRNKLVRRLGLKQERIAIRWFSTPGSPVYLISVDW